MLTQPLLYTILGWLGVAPSLWSTFMFVAVWTMAISIIVLATMTFPYFYQRYVKKHHNPSRPWW